MTDGQHHNILNKEMREITGAHRTLRKELDGPYSCIVKDQTLKKKVYALCVLELGE